MLLAWAVLMYRKHVRITWPLWLKCALLIAPAIAYWVLFHVSLVRMFDPLPEYTDYGTEKWLAGTWLVCLAIVFFAPRKKERHAAVVFVTWTPVVHSGFVIALTSLLGLLRSL